MLREQSASQVCVNREACPALVEIVAVAGAIALGSWAKLYLPFSPVPLTLQTFAVLVMALSVPTRSAVVGIMLYIALGLAGAPLFAGVAFGPTFGYILGFVLAPIIVRWVRKPAASIVLATLAIYVSGALWLAWWGRLSLSQAIAVGVAPFVAGDILKALAAYGCAKWLRNSAAE